MSVGVPDFEMITVDVLDGALALGQAFTGRQPPVLQEENHTPIGTPCQTYDPEG